jgi:hypothetical protein
MVTYLGTAFSLQMISPEAKETVIRVRKVTVDDVKEALSRGFISIVGHEATAGIMERILNVKVPVNRAVVRLSKGDVLVVFQLLHGRTEQTRELTPQEVEDVVNRGLYAIYIVTVES